MKMQALLAGTTVVMLTAGAQAITFGYTSFEEPGVFPGVQYVDTLDPLTDHDLLDNAGEPWVNWTGTNELGFNSYYRNTRDGEGLGDGDFVGVTDFTGTVGAYTDGTQGFQMSDPDGLMGICIDPVALAGPDPMAVSLDLYLQSTGWETDDSVRVWVEVDGGVEIDLLNTIGFDIDDEFGDLEGVWTTLSADLSGYTTATLYAELDSNSGSESIYLDNVVFATVPGPGALALFGLAGLVSRRRHR